MRESLYALCLVLLVAAACASPTGADPVSGDEELAGAAHSLALAQPDHGFLLETIPRLVDAGDDVRLCQVVVLPGTAADQYFVPRIETLLSPQSEELIVYAAQLGSETEAAMEPGANVPCTRAGEAFGEELSEVLATADRNTNEVFPNGSGKILYGGQKLALESHIVNESPKPVRGFVRLAVHLAARDRVQRVVRSANFENLTIYTPPGGHSSHVGECRVHENVVVTELVRRTQRFGTTFKVWFVGGARDGRLAWASSDRRDSRYEPSEPISLLSGEGFRFECSYFNSSGRELRYGVSASDETCLLSAKYTLSDEAEDSDDSDAEGCLLFDVDADGVARR